jgi:hypothetical protein
MNIMARWHMRCAEMPGRSRIFLRGRSLCECNEKSQKLKAKSLKLLSDWHQAFFPKPRPGATAIAEKRT